MLRISEYGEISSQWKYFGTRTKSRNDAEKPTKTFWHPRPPEMTVAQYWRQAGISYLRYVNICAGHVRAALKDSYRTEAIRSRDEGSFDAVSWDKGKEIARGMCAFYGMLL